MEYISKIESANDLTLMLGLNITIYPVGYHKFCSLLWLCVEERGWSCLERDIRL